MLILMQGQVFHYHELFVHVEEGSLDCVIRTDQVNDREHGLGQVVVEILQLDEVLRMSATFSVEQSLQMCLIDYLHVEAVE